MRLLLDTQVFLWWVEGDRRLPARARKAIADQKNECFVSLASAWELSIKASLGKLKLAAPVQRYVVDHVAANAFSLLQIRMPHVGRVETLPRRAAALSLQEQNHRRVRLAKPQAAYRRGGVGDEDRRAIA